MVYPPNFNSKSNKWHGEYLNKILLLQLKWKIAGFYFLRNSFEYFGISHLFHHLQKIEFFCPKRVKLTRVYPSTSHQGWRKSHYHTINGSIDYTQTLNPYRIQIFAKSNTKSKFLNYLQGYH